jgi:dienelactone hydrolase
MRLGGWAVALATLLLSACASRPDFVPHYDAPTNEGTEVLIPMEPGISSSAQLVGRVCRPDIAGRLPVVVINHGSPSRPDLRGLMQPTGCGTEAAQWFTDRGFVVVFALRRGFGRSTGPAVEDNGICRSPNYFRSGLLGAQDIDAILRYATSLPYVEPDAAVVIGQSTGGWATIAYNSVPYPLARAFISFAGGRGAHAFPEPDANCRPDLLIAAAKRYGETSEAPMLWIYAENDSSFPPALVNEMHTAYSRAGGLAQLVFTPPYGDEGHSLFYGPGGSGVWGPLVQSYLSQALRP